MNGNAHTGNPARPHASTTTAHMRWDSSYRHFGKGTQTQRSEPSPFQVAVMTYRAERTRALRTIFGVAAATGVLFAATCFSIGRWSASDSSVAMIQPALSAEALSRWEEKIANLEARNIDLKLALKSKENAIQDMGKLIWSWVEKERMRAIESETPLEVSQQLPASNGVDPTQLATVAIEAVPRAL